MKLEGADSTPVTTRALVKDGGLDEILKKIEGIGAFDGPLPALRATKSTMAATSKAAARKRGEKPLLIPDLVSVDEHEIGGTGGARIIIRANKAKVKLENVTLPMWIAANSRIMQELLTTGKLSGTSSISDYLSYTVKFAELLESHTFLSVVVYDSRRKSQHKYGFRWGSDSQLLHTRFLIKRRTLASSQPELAKFPAGNRPHQADLPICRQFNSPRGCQWPNCRFQYVHIVPNCNQSPAPTACTC